MTQQQDEAIRLMESGLAARACGELEEALQLHQQANKLLANNWAVLVNLGTAYQDLGWLDDAIDCFEHSWKLSHSPLALTNLALARLKKKPTTAAFCQFMARWNVPQWPQHPYSLPFPHVTEQLPHGKIIVMPDQGYGDTLMCLPFIRQLIAIKPDTVVLTKTPLLKLLSTGLSDLTDQIFTSVSGQFQGWLTGLDIPALLPSALADYDNERNKVEQLLRQHLCPIGPFDLGIVWKGNPEYALEKWRGISLTLLMTANRFRGNPSVVAAMPELTADEKQTAQECGIVVPEIDDFCDTARVILSVKELITTDTSSVHLAGLLGVKTSLLLSKIGDWRWGNAGTACLWYNSVTLHRQKQLGDWSAVLSDLR